MLFICMLFTCIRLFVLKNRECYYIFLNWGCGLSTDAVCTRAFRKTGFCQSQKLVPTKHKKTPIRQIRLPQNLVLHCISVTTIPLPPPSLLLTKTIHGYPIFFIITTTVSTTLYHHYHLFHHYQSHHLYTPSLSSAEASNNHAFDCMLKKKRADTGKRKNEIRVPQTDIYPDHGKKPLALNCF